MRYSEEIIEEVRMRNDIADVISGYVKLQKKGRDYFGLCPFHNEKSPSFSVSAAKQMYYCFGCGAGGNVITFVMEYENYSFSETLKLLADRAGVDLPEGEYSKEAREQEDLKHLLLEINRLAAGYFYYQLKNPQGEGAFRYLRERQLSEDTILHFGLGYSNKTSDDLYRYLREKGYGDDVLKQSGLVTIEEKGSHDKFWNRVMFPIMDVNSRVIGFGGRVMGQGEPKYLNSPETRLFDKSRNLYGLNYARLSREKYLLVCEGYMDVIAMHQAGFTNAVASLGTAFTSQQAQLLKRYTAKAVLAYDSDPAGVKAVLRAIPILKEAGLSVRVLNMQPYKDPDEFIKNEGAEGFRQRISEARNSFLFEIEVLKTNYRMDDPEQKTEFYRQIAGKLLEFPESLERENYMEAVSREFFINSGDLKRLVNRMGAVYRPAADEKEANGRPAGRKKPDREDGVKQSQRLLLTWLIEDPLLFDKINGVITPDDFVEELYRKVAKMVFDGHAAGNLNPAEILNHFIHEEEEYRTVAGLFHASLKESLNNEEQKKAFSETIAKVKKYSLDCASRHAQGIEELQRIIREQAALKDLHISLD